jgi:outer membrane immunogenic protein
LKTLIGMAAATLLAAGAASAAETGPQFDWNGLYFGANAGYGSGEVGLSNVTVNGAAATYGSGFSPDGGLVGGQIGYNYQTGNFVFGVETDLQWADISETNVLNDTAKLNYFGTVRGRLGYVMDRFMPYVTGGFAYGEGEATLRYSGVSLTDSQTHTGWTIGGGLEAALNEHVSLKAEYLYVDLGSQGYNWTKGKAAIAADGDLTANVIRAGINYRF